MYWKVSACVLLLARQSLALQSISPLLIHSTERDVLSTLQSQQIAKAQDVESELRWAKCHSGDLIIVAQQQLTVHQMQNMRLLQARIQEHTNGTTIQIPRLLGDLNAPAVMNAFGESCGMGRVETHQIAISGHEEADRIFAADTKLDALLAARSRPYTLILMKDTHASTQDHEPYTMDELFSSVQHVDLRREVAPSGAIDGTAAENEDDKVTHLPLFETYQFLSPAIFMGLGVTILLLSILYVALSAIAGLEVSYKAFSKEMGPSAQQKPK